MRRNAWTTENNQWHREDSRETQSWREQTRIRKPSCQAMVLTEYKNLLEVVNMRRAVLGEVKDVIHVDEAERKINQNLIHEVSEHVTRNSNSV